MLWPRPAAEVQEALDEAARRREEQRLAALRKALRAAGYRTSLWVKLG